MPKIQFTAGDIIYCEAFAYGISIPDRNNEVFIFKSEAIYTSFLKQYLRNAKGVDAYDRLRGEARFLVLSVELAETILPEDVAADSRYLGINVKCIRLSENNALFRDAERIFFTLYHPMSCLDLNERDITVVQSLDLPIYWQETNKPGDLTEQPF